MSEELKQAISALQCAKRGHCDHAMADEAIAALERALTQRPQAAIVGRTVGDGSGQAVIYDTTLPDSTPLYDGSNSQAVPMTDELEQEDFALFSQTQVAALLWVLWCHQGASSAIGQPIRFALGMGKRQALTDEQVSAAQRFRIDWHQWCGITQRADGGEQQA